MQGNHAQEQKDDRKKMKKLHGGDLRAVGIVGKGKLCGRADSPRKESKPFSTAVHGCVCHE